MNPLPKISPISEYHKWLPGAVLVLATWTAFFPVLSGEFVNFDDEEYVTENPMVGAGLHLDGVRWAFTEFHSANWHPLTWLSHMLDVSLFGLNPRAHHAMNLALHTVSALLLLHWLGKLGLSPWSAFWIAALFAWHPAHVESVAWISERKDLLSTLWGLLALVAYHRWVSAKRAAYYGLAVLWAACSLLSKPMLVTLPLLLLLLDWTIYQRISGPRDFRALWRCSIEKLPFFLLSAGATAVTLAAQEGDGAIMSLAQHSWPSRLMGVFAAYGWYLWTFFSPWPLYIPYEQPAPAAITAMSILGLVALGLVGAFLWHFRADMSLAMLGGFWFIILLIPVIGIVKAGEQFVADRYTYLAYIGPALLLAVAGERLSRLGIFPRRVVVVVAGGSLAVFAGLTWHQAGHWHSSETLFRHTLAHAPHNATAHNNLGTALMAQGAVSQALYHFQEATSAAPGNIQAQNNLGVALLLLGRAEQAARQFVRVLEHTPEDAEVWVNLGAAEWTRGAVAPARNAAQRALELAPENTRARALLDRMAGGG